MVCSPRVQNGKVKQLYFPFKRCVGVGEWEGGMTSALPVPLWLGIITVQNVHVAGEHTVLPGANS